MDSQEAGGMSRPILQGSGNHRDPVCGMMVAPEKAAAKLEHAGKTYYFCSKNCAERFSREPEKFVLDSGTAGMADTKVSVDRDAIPQAEAAAAHTKDKKKILYTCPMHPHIVQFVVANFPNYGVVLAS